MDAPCCLPGRHNYTVHAGAPFPLGANQTTAADSATANITNNTFNFTNGGTGLNLAAAGTSTLGLQSNNISFANVAGNGMLFALSKASQTQLISNTITNAIDGIDLNLVGANSKFQIDGNQIGATTHGIFFSNVTPSMTLTGTVNNVITGAATPFFVPANSSTGQIIVNGVSRP